MLCVLLGWPLLLLWRTHALSLCHSMLCHTPPRVLPILFREARGFATQREAPNVLTFWLMSSALGLCLPLWLTSPVKPRDDSYARALWTCVLWMVGVLLKPRG